MMDLLENLRQNQRLVNWAVYAMVAAMMACFMVSVMQVGRALSPTFGGAYLVLLGFFVALEAFTVHRMHKEFSFPELGWFAFYLSEWVVLMLAIKLFQLASHGGAYFLAEINGWRSNFLASFFNSEYQFALVALIIVWVVSLMLAQPVDVLRIDENRLRVEEETGMSEERSEARRQIIDTILFVGVIMVLLTSMLRSDLSAQWFNLPAMRLGVVNVVVYFALGLVLLSLTQFTVLQMRWSVNRVSIHHRLAARWFQYTLAFLGLLAILALMIPTGYARDLLFVLNWILQVLIAILFLIYQLLTLPFVLIGILLGMLAGNPVEQPFEPIPPVPPMETTPEAPSTFLSMLRAVLITVLLLGLVLFSLVYFFSSRRGQLAGMRRMPFISWLLSVWNALAAWLRGFGQAAADSFREGVQRLRRPTTALPSATPWQYLGLRGLTPRQKVLFYYLAFVRRGGETGIQRRPSQTPSEYAASLSAALRPGEPDASSPANSSEDIQSITESFLTAQYSRQEITGEQANEVRGIWERLRQAFRRRRRSAGSYPASKSR